MLLLKKKTKYIARTISKTCIEHSLKPKKKQTKNSRQNKRTRYTKSNNCECGTPHHRPQQMVYSYNRTEFMERCNFNCKINLEPSFIRSRFKSIDLKLDLIALVIEIRCRRKAFKTLIRLQSDSMRERKFNSLPALSLERKPTALFED